MNPTDIIGRILEVIKWLWPFRIVRLNEQGVRKTLGQMVGPLEPGWYWCIPFIQEFEIETTLLDSLDLHIKSLTSSDGREVALEVTLWFRIFDAFMLWNTVNDHQENLARLAAGHSNVKVRRRTWASLRKNQNKLEHALADYCDREARNWGIEIPAVQITQITSPKTYRFLGGFP